MKTENFFEHKNVAVLGVSSKKKKFGNYIYEKLLDSGYNAFAVNPNADVNNEIKFYKSIEELNNISSLVFVTKPNVTNQILTSKLPENIKYIWIQQGAGDDETKSILSSLNIDFIYDKCVMMYLEPVKGIHKFHRTISKIFGSYKN